MILASVAGQDVAKRLFERALEEGRLAHAYLLAGPEESGKLPFALELAKALFCTAGRPCGACKSCNAVDHGSHTDLHVLGPAEGKTIVDIDTIRRLCERTHYRQRSLQVIILDQADRMNEPAANALLKTLEEPPENVILILLAQSTGALPSTIVSRCHRVPLLARSERRADIALASREMLALPLEKHFFAETDPKDWLQRVGAGGTNARATLRGVVETLIALYRDELPRAAPKAFDEAASALEELLQLAGDLERNVQADLVLERLLRVIRSTGWVPGV